MLTPALLTTALLFGGAARFSFGLAPLVFAAPPPDLARSTIRRAFPPFYLFVIVASPTRQVLTPAIDRASDSGEAARFEALHGASVAITLVHIALAACVLARFAARVAA